ncbi:MAG: CRTAC1 family protein [Acidobacteria bacterium]|nr:CRTAC1 family protein [Acidobacteriota bacterium]
MSSRRARSAPQALLRAVLAVWLVALLPAAGSWRSVPSTPTPQFVDVAHRAGLHFRHSGGYPEKRYVMEETSGGVAFLDYDNDGWLDVYLVNGFAPESYKSGKGLPNKLFRNKGDGTFEDVTAVAGVGDTGWGMGVCVGDYDNDGWIDLYVTNLGPNVLYRNNRNGTFTDVTTKAGVGDPRFSLGAAFADYDRDGDLDLFVANYVEVDLKNLPAPGSSKFCLYRGIQVACGPRGLKGAGDSLYRNNGDGTFSDVSRVAGVADPPGYYGMGVVWGDYDEDGDPDLYVANDSTPNYLYKNNGDGTFNEIGLLSGVAVNEDGREQASMGVDFGDYDGDGRLDIYVTNFADDTNTLYRNLGNDFFADTTFQAGLGEPTWRYLGWGTKFFDYDQDGRPDLFIANGHVFPQVDSYELGTRYRQRNQLFRNVDGKRFDEVSAKAGPGLAVENSSRGAAFGDFDNDGDVDIVINNMDDTPTLLRNDGGNQQSWILVRLVGNPARGSNRNAVGARVRVEAGTLSLLEEVKSGASYISQNDFRLHFGLGTHDRVRKLHVRWPSGRVQTFDDVEARRLVVIDEEKGILRPGASAP